MSYYVKRERFNSIGWTGPIRSPRQAEKEKQAWIAAGWTATTMPSTPKVRRQIREWERARISEFNPRA